MSKLADQKMMMFLKGWNIHAAFLVRPDAMKKVGETEIIPWEKRLEALSVFQCKDFGEKEGKIYAEACGMVEN